MPEETKPAAEPENKEVKPTESVGSQAHIERIIDTVTARLNRKFEKMLKERFGTSNLSEAGEYAQAGRLVSQNAGKPPSEVIQRLAALGGAGTAGITGSPDPLTQELRSIRQTLDEQHTEKRQAVEAAEARQEFGSLYDAHQDEILELASDRGLSLVDAAAVVLRPHLRTHIEQEVKTKQQTQRERSVETGAGAAGSGGSVDYRSKLSAEQIRVAQKQGVSLEKIYNRLKALGKVD